MLNGEAQAATTKILLSPVSAANTAAATSGWVDARDAEGDIMFINQVGSLTGTITWTIETASDGSGTGAVAIVPLVTAGKAERAAPAAPPTPSDNPQAAKAATKEKTHAQR